MARPTAKIKLMRRKISADLNRRKVLPRALQTNINVAMDNASTLNSFATSMKIVSMEAMRMKKTAKVSKM
jgi:hypothetical protein